MFKLSSKLLSCRRIYNFRTLSQVTLRETPLCSNKCPLKHEGKRKYSSEENWIVSSAYKDIDIPNISFGQFILDRQESYSKNIALVDGDTDETWTYSDIQNCSLRLASAMSRLGLGKGDVIAIVAPNCPEFLVSFIAISVIGATSTTVNTSYTCEEIVKQLEDSESVAIIAHSLLLPKVNEAKKCYKNLRQVICIDKEEEGTIHLKKLFKDDGKGIPQNLKIDPKEDLLVLPYSSGTTGLPKGVMLTHRNIIANILQMMNPELCRLTPSADSKEVFIGILPMFHIFGMVGGMLACNLAGGKMVTLKTFDPKQYLQILAKYPPTLVHTVPPILSFLVGSDLVKKDLFKNAHSVVCGAAPAGPALINAFLNKFGTEIDFQEGFGMTEASPVTHMTPKKPLVVGSCGTTICNTYSKLVDIETGKTVDPTIHEGELCIKGPQVMKGYLRNEKATRETLVDGWLRSGDIAKFDKEGNVFIVDRLKELIKVKGLQVAPAELEDILRQHPYVSDVAVVGVPDERAGELPKAFVVSSKTISEEELKKYVAEKVAPHKKLDGGVEFIDLIPKSATGKILRKMLK